MIILVLGGNGMAGHVITDYLKKHTNHTIYFTTRDSSHPNGLILDASDEMAVKRLLLQVKPDIVINCIGILNKDAARHPTQAIRLNALLPHQLASHLDKWNGKLMQISTDCVFLGDKGDYTEDDRPDGTTVYAKTKALGEVSRPPHVTIRTSIIGPEKKDGIGLFHWFVGQKGTINGFRQAMWNGVTTLELAKVIQAMIEQDVQGLYHLTAPEKVSKYELLKKIQQVFDKKDVVIEADDQVIQDRSLVNTRSDLDYHVPNYETMLKQLKVWMEDSTL